MSESGIFEFRNPPKPLITVPNDILRVWEHAFLRFQHTRNHHTEEEASIINLLKIFRKNDNAVKRWRLKAMLVDTRKTRLTILSTADFRHVPPWVYKKFVPTTDAKKE
jgi:hypothetical protein